MKTTTISVMVTVLALTCAAAATAQQKTASAPSPGGPLPLGDKVFVSVNVGAQTRTATLTKDFSFPLYRETATVSTNTTVSRGAFFDVSGGYRFMPQFGVAVGFSNFSSTGDTQGTASIPNPTFFNRPAAVVIVPRDAPRKERSTYVVLVGFLPVAEKVDLAVFVGPSFTRVTQDVIYDASVVPGTQSVVSPVRTETGTAKGINIGGDISYQFMKMVGAGFFLRYNGGSVDLTTIPDVKAGGLQVGVGARLRF